MSLFCPYTSICPINLPSFFADNDFVHSHNIQQCVYNYLSILFWHLMTLFCPCTSRCPMDLSSLFADQYVRSSEGWFVAQERDALIWDDAAAAGCVEECAIFCHQLSSEICIKFVFETDINGVCRWQN